MNTPVSFELAKLLKEKGFDRPTVQFYERGKKPYLTEAQDYMSDRYAVSNWNDGMGSYPTKAEDVYCSAPTIAEVVMWLYEKHGIWIWVERYSTLFRPYAEEIGNERFGKWEGHKFNSPTEAYEAAIECTLKNLL
jgi:hypothetical protein